MTRTLYSIAIACIIGIVPAHAQEISWPRWWFGLFGGANINMFSGVVRTPSPAASVVSPDGFTSGTGVGLALGAMLEFNSGGLLGGNLMIGYDNRSVEADPVGVETLTMSPAYLSIEPNVRVNIAGRALHLLVGPSIAINVGNTYQYARNDSATVEGELADLRTIMFGGQAALAYDIPLSSAGAWTQVLLTPFVQGRVGMGLSSHPQATTTS
jgi:hypothetical protein